VKVHVMPWLRLKVKEVRGGGTLLAQHNNPETAVRPSSQPTRSQRGAQSMRTEVVCRQIARESPRHHACSTIIDRYAGPQKVVAHLVDIACRV
jgi:hypothetical protein